MVGSFKRIDSDKDSYTRSTKNDKPLKYPTEPQPTKTAPGNVIIQRRPYEYP